MEANATLTLTPNPNLRPYLGSLLQVPYRSKY